MVILKWQDTLSSQKLLVQAGTAQLEPARLTKLHSLAGGLGTADQLRRTGFYSGEFPNDMRQNGYCCAGGSHAV